MRQETRRSIAIASPDIGPDEEEAVLRVLRSGRLVQGPEVEALEREFSDACGVTETIAVANGTAALHVALHAGGVKTGDEVLVPAFTFAATANAVLAVGARPVFVDVDDSGLMDIDDARAKCTDRTTAILPVHLYGLMVDMDAVDALARDRGLLVVEDAAQSHLARRGGRFAGATGIGAFSLYATKNMMCGEGGLVTTSSPEVAGAARLFRNHGMPARYHHDEWGMNFRLTDLQASLARVQLAKLPAANETRRRIAAFYDRELSDSFAKPVVPADAVHVFHQYVVRVPADLRDRLLARLKEEGVGADVYYPTSVPEQPAFASYGDPGDCPRSMTLSREVIALPVHPKVSEDDRAYVVEVANRLVGELG